MDLEGYVYMSKYISMYSIITKEEVMNVRGSTGIQGKWESETEEWKWCKYHTHA